MPFSQISLSLRPIKFAFLADPDDPAALLQAIRANLFLWGGPFNPIIPFYEVVPDSWTDRPGPPMTPKDIIEGYIRMFDPDEIVVCGKLDPQSAFTAGRALHKCADFISAISKDGRPPIGVGLHEILGKFAEQEFKFIRHDGMKLLVPTYDQAGISSTFLASMFGDVPPEGPSNAFEKHLSLLQVERATIRIDNYLQYLPSTNARILMRHLCFFKLKVRRRTFDRADVIFLMDHTLPLDIIDYWNLRAIGWNVLPIAKVVSGSSLAIEISRQFIAENNWQDPESPAVRNYATILKARSVSKDDHLAFVNSLRQHDKEVLTVQTWYPPMWDEFAHQKGHLRCAESNVEERETQIGDTTAPIWLNAISPDFMYAQYGANHRYANTIRMSFYGRQDLGAEALPSNDASVARLFGFGDPADWRIAANGLTFLGSHVDQSIHIQQPSSMEVASKYLDTHGWTNAKTSPAGNVAYQMMRHLGGPFGIAVLKNKKLIEYLKYLSEGQGRVASDRDFFAKMNEINAAYPIRRDVHQFAQRLINSNIFALGLEIQCSVCTQRSWHTIESIKSEILCPKCLSTFKLPTHNPRADLGWSYKALGPFASPHQASGAFAVLLAVNFLREHQHPSTTTILSFTAERADAAPLEADFMMFYGGSGFRDGGTELLFGECKTFNRFETRDVERMQLIADSFPGSVMVFATLNQSFSQDERDVLVPFVKKCRAYWKLDRPLHPILFLTGIELFSPFGAPSCWKGQGEIADAMATAGRGVHTLLAFCDATQQIHLGLDSWWKDWNEEFSRRGRAR